MSKVCGIEKPVRARAAQIDDFELGWVIGVRKDLCHIGSILARLAGVAWHLLIGRWGLCLIHALEKKRQSDNAKLADCRRCADLDQRSHLQSAGNTKEFCRALHQALAFDLLRPGAWDEPRKPKRAHQHNQTLRNKKGYV